MFSSEKAPRLGIIVMLDMKSKILRLTNCTKYKTSPRTDRGNYFPRLEEIFGKPGKLRIALSLQIFQRNL